MINDNTAQWKLKKITNVTNNFDGYWQAREVVEVGTLRFPRGQENTGYILECVEAGTTGSTQPEIIINSNEVANYAEVGRVGQVRVIFNLAEKDVDEVMAMGITYSRLTYPELWEWAGKRAGLIISEEEWQAKFAETNGKFVPYYSSGDGSSTFRTPLLGAYLKGAESSADVGKWLDAGLPNIIGYLGQLGAISGTQYGVTLEDAYTQGAFEVYKIDGELGIASTPLMTPPSGGNYPTARFDASKWDDIYGNSNTVTPETMTGIWVIKAVGVVVDSGETDIAQVLTATEQVQEKVSAVEDTHKIKTFTSLEQLGLQNDCTPSDIVEALPNNSMIVCFIEGYGSNALHPNIGIADNGTLIIRKTIGTYMVELWFTTPKKTRVARYVNWETPKFSGWKELANRGGLSMPSNTAITISTSNSISNYTAPCDGWVCANGSANAGAYLYLHNQTAHMDIINVYSGTGTRACYIPVKKGDVCRIEYNNMKSVTGIFVYAQSEV